MSVMEDVENSSDDNEENLVGVFEEPNDYYEKPRVSTIEEHTLLSGGSLRVHLVGNNPLWGHHLWNAGRTLATYLEQHRDRFLVGRTVLELGAGGGLPSLVAAVNGAKTVLVTDYPDEDLIENLRRNIGDNKAVSEAGTVRAMGYLWGAPTDSLLANLHSLQQPPGPIGFDTLILGDLLFNHSEHAKLVTTVKQTLKHSSTSVALVFFTPYRPWLLQKDLAFFELAAEQGLHVEKVFETVMDKVMFDDDPGDELLRRTVYGYELCWPAS